MQVLPKKLIMDSSGRTGFWNDVLVSLNILTRTGLSLNLLPEVKNPSPDATEWFAAKFIGSVQCPFYLFLTALSKPAQITVASRVAW